MPTVRYKAKRVGRYRSKLEQRLFKSRPRRKGVKYSYETTKLPYTITRNYIPDFTITFPSGRVLYIEAKGFFRVEDKAKMRAVKNAHPGLDIRIVFSGSSLKNTKWCERHGFPFAIGAIPSEWLLDDEEKED